MGTGAAEASTTEVEDAANETKLEKAGLRLVEGPRHTGKLNLRTSYWTRKILLTGQRGRGIIQMAGA